MKKLLFAMTMLLTLSLGVQSASQKHRHTPQAELVDSTSKDAVEVYSDTSSTDSVTVQSKVTVTTRTSPWTSYSKTYEFDDEDFGSMMSHIFTDLSGKDLAGMFFALSVLFILFVLAPVLIIVALFYFINKNRKEKMKLAQMAMQQGQPIPEQLLDKKSGNVSDEYQSGLRQCFVGVGLMIFLGLTAGEVGFGIGALVFCIGLGKIVSAKMAEKKNDNINNLNQNNHYDKETGAF